MEVSQYCVCAAVLNDPQWPTTWSLTAEPSGSRGSPLTTYKLAGGVGVSAVPLPVRFSGARLSPFSSGVLLEGARSV